MEPFKGHDGNFFEDYLRYLAICFAFSCNTFALPHNTFLPSFLLSHTSISEQRPSMDQLTEFYFELDIKYADIVLLLNSHGYVITVLDSN